MEIKHLIIQDYGGYKFIYDLAFELSKSLKVHYLYSRKSGGAINDFKTGRNLSIYDIETINFDKGNFFLRRRAEKDYGYKASNYINKFDSLNTILVSTNTPLDALKIIHTNNTNLRHIVWLQDFLSAAISSILVKRLPIFGRFISWYYFNLEKSILSDLDTILTISNDLKNRIEQAGILGKIQIFENWAPIERINFSTKPTNFGSKMNINDKFVVLYSGSIGYKHDPSIIIEAANKLKDLDDIVFIIIGKGVGIKYLLEKKQFYKLTNIKILDYQPEKIYNEVLATSDTQLVLLNREAQSFSVPSKTWTAMCSGKPIITNLTQENLAGKIILENDCGLLITDNIDLSTCIKTLYYDDKLKNKLGYNGRKFARKNFSIHDKATKFKNHIKFN